MVDFIPQTMGSYTYGLHQHFSYDAINTLSNELKAVYLAFCSNNILKSQMVESTSLASFLCTINLFHKSCLFQQFYILFLCNAFLLNSIERTQFTTNVYCTCNGSYKSCSSSTNRIFISTGFDARHTNRTVTNG